MLHRPLYRFLGRFLNRHDRRKLATKILLQTEFDYSIRNSQLVNSRTILFACDIHPHSPKSSVEDKDYLNSITSQISSFIKINPAKNPSIYVPSDGLIYFAHQIMPNLSRPFVLVSGDSDLSINASHLGSAITALLGSPLLLDWYAQNKDFNHPKLHTLPIGINLHNLWSNPLEWGGGFILPALQELQIQTISEQAPPLFNRQPFIFCNWHFSIDRADRKECFERINRSICYFQEQPLPMAQAWQLQSQYQFVLSPHGAGFDCHRTWEALLLGCIPIIKKANINDLFSDLPVIEVSDWGDISQDFLNQSLEKIGRRVLNKEKLFNAYWKSKIYNSTIVENN
jgi:hypothetical protein